MPNRIIREGILTSLRVDLLSLGGELFYRRLMSVADDFGRYTAHPTLLRSQLYPLKVDVVTESQVSVWLEECVTAGLISRYSDGNGHFLVVKDFNQRTRAMKSRFPDPDTCHTDDSHVADAGGHLRSSAHGDGDGDGDVIRRRKTKTKARKEKPIPEDFAPTDKHEELAQGRGINLAKAVEFYRNWAQSKGALQVNWNAAFTNALNGWLGEKFTESVKSATGSGLKEWTG